MGEGTSRVGTMVTLGVTVGVGVGMPQVGITRTCPIERKFSSNVSSSCAFSSAICSIETSYCSEIVLRRSPLVTICSGVFARWVNRRRRAAPLDVSPLPESPFSATLGSSSSSDAAGFSSDGAVARGSTCEVALCVGSRMTVSGELVRLSQNIEYQQCDQNRYDGRHDD